MSSKKSVKKKTETTTIEPPSNIIDNSIFTFFYDRKGAFYCDMINGFLKPEHFLYFKCNEWIPCQGIFGFLLDKLQKYDPVQCDAFKTCVTCAHHVFVFEEEVPRFGIKKEKEEK
jgi:hypothetical protein